MNKKLRLLLLVIICLYARTYAQAQDSSKIKVYIDCRTGCDFTYMRTEIQLVDFVTDRTVADAHVLITAQGVGSGGAEYLLQFFGQKRFRQYVDRLLFVTNPNATADDVRAQMARTLMLGLVPMIAKTNMAAGIHLSMKEEGKMPLPPYESDAHDKWNFWVFRIGARGELNADQVYHSKMWNGNFSANRTTDKLKVEFYLSNSRRKTVYTLDDNGTPSKYSVKNSDYGIFHNIVRSIGPHWSYGYQASFSNNTFNNIESRIYFNPALEYNIFPYKEINNRSFILRYGVDVGHNEYYDTTIYNKIRETVYGHRVSAALTFNKKWGTFFSGINYRNFFHDWKLNSMGISVNTDVRIVKGLSFFVYANASVVHNQISLVKGEASEQEVLTRQRQLASTYNYYTSFGLAYRFGSLLNNVVNPRFEGYGGF